MAENAAEIDALVANGKLTALQGAMAKLRFIGPQSMTPAERALAAGQMPSENDAGSVISPGGVLGAAKNAMAPTPQGQAADAALAAAQKPGKGAMETPMPSTGMAKGGPSGSKLAEAAKNAMGAKPAAPLASGKVAANGGGVSGVVEEDNPWRNGDAAQATGEILDNTPGIGAITKPNYAKNYAGSAGAGALLDKAADPVAPVANTGPQVGTPGQPMPTTGKPVKVPSLDTLVEANSPAAKQLDPALDLPAPDNTKRAAQKQALVQRRQALTAELAQIEQQLAQMGAA